MFVLSYYRLTAKKKGLKIFELITKEHTHARVNGME